MHSLMHAEKMARGEEAYQGKLLEARQSTIRRIRFDNYFGSDRGAHVGSDE